MVQSPDSRCVSKPQPEPSRADLRVELELTIRMVLFRIADGPHEPLLERHTVVRGLCTRRRFLPTFTTATCEPFRAARSSVSVVTHATGAIAIDAIADLELQAADRLIGEVRAAAPGSAPIIEAGAAAWLVRANAYTQSALSELMRLRAIDLANAGAELKLDAQHGTELRGNVTDALKRR